MAYETISIIGLGYIGLPTAAVFASRKKKVIGVDVNQQAVDTINRGQIHIVEPDLDMVVQASVKEGYLRATTKPESADAFFIAVPTPFKGEHEPDLSYIEAAAQAIASVLKKGDAVILESTSPVGTTEQMAAWLATARPDLSFPQDMGEASDIRIAYCPELVNNDRVIGGMTPKCSAVAAELYKVFVRGECIITNARTAEMCKLTENSFRDVNIAFANELSMICDKLDINVWELIRLANRHPRVNILQPGPGVGGHCIAVDPWFIVSKTPEQARLIRTAREVNDSKPQAVIDHVKVEATKFKCPVIACLGLAFKADIDDLRESPAVEIVQQLIESRVATIYVAEPHIETLPTSFEGESVYFAEAKVAIEKADVVLLLVNHRIFKDISLGDLDGKVVIDTRGMWESVE
jgi:UDP-N-acetyl-D-mannosaminuronic acid dehydrogenase